MGIGGVGDISRRVQFDQPRVETGGVKKLFAGLARKLGLVKSPARHNPFDKLSTRLKQGQGRLRDLARGQVKTRNIMQKDLIAPRKKMVQFLNDKAQHFRSRAKEALGSGNREVAKRYLGMAKRCEQRSSSYQKQIDYFSRGADSAKRGALGALKLRNQIGQRLERLEQSKARFESLGQDTRLMERGDIARQSRTRGSDSGAGFLQVTGNIAKGLARGLQKLGSGVQHLAKKTVDVTKKALSRLGSGIQTLAKSDVGKAQLAVTPEQCKAILPKARLMRAFCADGIKDQSQDHAKIDRTAYTPLDRSEIPDHFQGWYAKADPNSTDTPPKAYLQRGAVRVGVVRDNKTGNYVLAFKGTEMNLKERGIATNHANVMNAFGGVHSSLRDARDLVKAFAEKAKREGVKVEVMGHSLGGLMAQWAGRQEGVSKITGFNSEGLSGNLRDQLARRGVDVPTEHFNTANDILSQKVQTRYLNLIPKSKLIQTGDRFKVPEQKFIHRLASALKTGYLSGVDAHSMGNVLNCVEAMANKA